MEFEIISRKAYNKEKLEEFSNFAEKYAYVQMLNLYMEYKNENITKAQAEKEKKEIEKEYNENLRKYNNYCERLQKQNLLKAKYEEYLYSIEKSQDQDDLLLNSLKFIEVVVQDDSLFDRNYNKVKNT